MRNRNKLFISLIILASIPALRALAIPEHYTSHDGVTHTARIANYYLALKESQVPPKLAPNLFGNLGFPIFVFIYPLPYLLGSFFHTLGLSFTDSFEMVISLSFVFSAITMFLFSREIFGKKAGFIAAIFYSWAPYRFSQIYVRGAVAESFAYIFIPLVLLSLFKFSQKKTNTFRWIGFGGLSLAGLLLSHQLVSAMFLPIISIFGLMFLSQVKNKKTYLIQSIVMGLLGLATAAFIYAPSLFERKFLQFDRLISYYQDHFVTLKQLIHSPWSYGFSMKGAENDDMSFQVGLTQLLVVVISFFLLISKLIKKNKILRNFKFQIAVISFLIFSISIGLMLEYPLTHLIWKRIPLIATIDLPWRLLGISVFSVSILAAYLISTTKSKVLFAFLLFFIFYANRNHLRINKTYIRNDKYFLSYLDTATWQNEFLPNWRKTNKWQNIEKDFRISQGEVDVITIKSKTHELILELDSQKGGTIDIHRLYFPGWTIYLDGNKLSAEKDYEISQNIQIETESTPYIDRSGFPSIPLTAGSHILKAEFKQTPIRKSGSLISSIGFISSIALLIKPERKINKKKKAK